MTKPLDPYDEIEITVHIIPKDISFDNFGLQAPSFTFTCVEPDEVLGEGEQVYEGIGTNMPERVYVMNNRDYNLSVANHADKWAVFWLFTVSVGCIPLMMQRRNERGFARMIRKGKEAAAKEQEAQKKIEASQAS